MQEQSNNAWAAMVTPVARIGRDMIKAMRQQSSGGSVGGITSSEARYLVDLYYTMQKQRIATNNRVKGLDRDAAKSDTEAEPHDAMDWTLTQFGTLEGQVARILGAYAEGHPMSWFFERTLGIGPVLAAGLLAHIDINQCPTVGHIWNFAGLNPDRKWEKGQKRPWNTPLKTLCWKIGDSFVKLSGRKDAYYGQVYRQRKAAEWARNLAGELRDQATAAMGAKRFGDATDAKAWYSGACDPAKAAALLEQGKAVTAAACKADDPSDGLPMLPPAHIDARARRYAVKLFLSHLHECWWTQEMGEAPAKPFAIAILNHGHYLPPPQRADINH